MCAKSKNIIGDKVFAVFPNGVVVSHQCVDPTKLHICPITG